MRLLLLALKTGPAERSVVYVGQTSTWLCFLLVLKKRDGGGCVVSPAPPQSTFDLCCWALKQGWQAGTHSRSCDPLVCGSVPLALKSETAVKTKKFFLYGKPRPKALGTSAASPENRAGSSKPENGGGAWPGAAGPLIRDNIPIQKGLFCTKTAPKLTTDLCRCALKQGQQKKRNTEHQLVVVMLLPLQTGTAANTW